ncbi:hypothetical protein ACH5RR_021287 [Cinchona calisaya]|uniref:Uncharacterized protein n=1 Tax=Cinchona calisaya TaxID=153742 RepID=A0ABD2ZH22_9GENT
MATVYLSNLLDEGLGHSFCYIRLDSGSKIIHSSFDDSSNNTQTIAFRTISRASISANTSIALSTTLINLGPYNSSLNKATAFKSSNLFTSIPSRYSPEFNLHNS